MKNTGASFVLIALMLVKMNWLQVTAEEVIIGNLKCVIEPWMYCERNVRDYDCMPYSIETCKRAAKSLGYDLGGYGYPFVGEGLFYTPGCVGYDATGNWSNSVYYGTGASVELMARTPTNYDNEFRPPGYDCK